MRYTIKLSYDGRNFQGWQIQPSGTTVQGELQRALSTLLRSEVSVTGAGRTDTSVNAVGYVAHFDFDSPLPFSGRDFAYKLNAILPRQIVVHEVKSASDDFHARFDATLREYHYFIHFSKDPFAESFSWRCHHRLDLEAMNKACEHLLGTHDFSCFEKTGGNNATSICTIREARWERYTPTHCQMMDFPGDEYIVFTVSADRFLRNMVRAIVGSMVEVGRGKKNPQWIKELVLNGTRCDAGESVPGHALFLSRVDY